MWKFGFLCSNDSLVCQFLKLLLQLLLDYERVLICAGAWTVVDLGIVRDESKIANVFCEAFVLTMLYSLLDCAQSDRLFNDFVVVGQDALVDFAMEDFRWIVTAVVGQLVEM